MTRLCHSLRKDRTMIRLFLALVVSWTWLASGTTTAAAAADVATDEALDATKTLIAGLPTRKFYINGKWKEPTTNDRSLEVIDPSTAETVATLAVAGPDDVDAAVTAAKEAWSGWAFDTPPEERRSLVRNLLGVFAEKIEEMARLVSTEMGSPIDAARGTHAYGSFQSIRSILELMEDFEFVRSLPNVQNAYEDERHTTIIYEPIGVVGMITPWNYPMSQIVLKVIPALLVGCTCVLKPSEESPLSALLFAEMMHEAGFPPGVFNLVSGDGPYTGDALTRHPFLDMVSFTGSTRAGRAVATNAALGPIPATLELGGKGANLLFADISSKERMEEIIKDGIEAVVYNSGQTCNAPTRMLVQEPYYELALEVAAEYVRNHCPVDTAHAEGEEHIGPVVNQRQFDKIQVYIQTGIDEGATLIAGGLGKPDNLKDSKGYYVRPTVFAGCTNTMTIMREEIFGPVLCISRFETEEEALAIANDTPYGLTNYVHTSSLKRRRRLGRRLRSGMVNMNDAYSDEGSPFGGVRGSGYGREDGIFGLEEYCIIKAVTGFDELDGDTDEEDDDDDDDSEVDVSSEAEL